MHPGFQENADGTIGPTDGWGPKPVSNDRIEPVKEDSAIEPQLRRQELQELRKEKSPEDRAAEKFEELRDALRDIQRMRPNVGAEAAHLLDENPNLAKLDREFLISIIGKTNPELWWANPEYYLNLLKRWDDLSNNPDQDNNIDYDEAIDF